MHNLVALLLFFRRKRYLMSLMIATYCWLEMVDVTHSDQVLNTAPIH